MLTVENLNKKYVSQGSETLALVDINLRIEEGEFVCLLGPSGCGKSTLLKIIAGLIPATSGRITINGLMPLLRRLRATCPRVVLVWADGGYAGALVAWCAAHLSGLRLAIVKRSDTARGFVVLHRRWCVERTLSWITCRRRCVRDYERRDDTSEAMVRWAMTYVMTRRLARPAPRR